MQLLYLQGLSAMLCSMPMQLSALNLRENQLNGTLPDSWSKLISVSLKLALQSGGMHPGLGHKHVCACLRSPFVSCTRAWTTSQCNGYLHAATNASRLTHLDYSKRKVSLLRLQ